MSKRPAPQNYRLSQIILHWVVVVGVIIQIAFNDPIVRVTKALPHNGVPVSTDVTLAWVHVGVGSTILLAVIARLYMRFRYGVPGHAPGTPPLQAKLADAMHWSLYAALLGMVVTGMLTWNGIAPLGGLHSQINIALFFLAIAHALAAIFNQVVRKDGTLSRMNPLRRPA